jgi:hypothetical protein
MSGQTLLTLGGFTILSLLTLNANRLILNSFQGQLQTRQVVAAIAQANSLLEEIQSKAFDQVVSSNSAGGKVNQNKNKKPSDLTPSPLGPESGEHYPFNDVDDYNGYHCKAWNPLFADSLSLSATVFYVNSSDPSQQASTQTSLKKVVVRVFAAGMADTLAIQQVVYQ